MAQQVPGAATAQPGGELSWHVLLYWIGYVAAMLLLLNYLAFMLLGFSPLALRIVLHPLWSRVLVLPPFLLSNIGLLQRRVLRRYFFSVGAGVRWDAPYVDLPVVDTAGQKARAGSLLGRLKAERRIWLQGNLGMGKTAAVHAWERAYFAEQKTFVDAVRQFGFIFWS